MVTFSQISITKQ